MITAIIFSVGSLVISSILAGTAHKLFQKRKNLKRIYILLAGAFAAILSMMLYVDRKPGVDGIITGIFLAIFHSIQVMVLGYDFENLYDVIDITEQYSTIVYPYLSLLFVLAPAYTFGFVLSFFKNITAYIIYMFKSKSDIYIISDLTEKSLVLAGSIREKYPKSIIAFMNVSSDSSETAFDFIEKSKSFRAIHFKKGIEDIGLKFHRKNTKAIFFAINEDESVNLESALSVIDKFNQRRNTELYVFSTSKEGQLLLDSVKDEAIKVRRINEDRSLAYSIINNYPITQYYTTGNGKKILSTLIVGFGGYGSELTKALLWCGQLPDYDLELNIVDMDPEAEARFQADCPEILLLNGNTEFGEARYNIKFYNGVDVHTYNFNEIISSLSNTAVVYVSLGNDELNIETAINIRILFERIGLYPTIKAIVYSNIKCKTLNNSSLANHQGESYDIEFIGNINERYSYDTIINEELETLALECHLRWANSPSEKEQAIRQFNEYEYFRNSSTATAIHEKYRKKANLTDDIAAVTEHMRWNAYMRTEGFVFSGSCDEKSRNDRAKMHNNLHRFGLLDGDGINKNRRIASKKY